jgi:hypothetical protein
MPHASDEAQDPRQEMEDQLQGMAQELLRTADLAALLGWSDFDFEIDLFDPRLDDLESVISEGRATSEQLSALLAPAMDGHVTLPVRLKLLREVERRIAGEVRLDVRSQGVTVIKALHHLPLRASSIGLLWKLYPPQVLNRLRERRQELAREESNRSAEEAALEDPFMSGQGDLATVKKLALPALERILFGWESSPPSDPAVARELIAAVGMYPGRRAARALGMVLWARVDPSIQETARAGLASMPEPGREIVRHHLLYHDPPPEARRALFTAAMDLGDERLLPLALEDAFGAGPWAVRGEGAEHTATILGPVLRSGRALAVPVSLHLLAQRPPKAEVRTAILKAFEASPLAAAFQEGLVRLESGRPVVVPAEMSQEEFLEKYGTFQDRMAPAAFQAEVRRMSAVWEECWHESLGWRRPADVAAEAGPREKDLLGRLARETRSALGRLAGRSPVAELEREFKVKWMTTPQNDVSGRIPLAIVLDERAARRGDPEDDRVEREEEAAELYARALRAHEARMEDDARHFARAALQILPNHPFAKDLIERLDAGAGVPGLDATAEPSSVPRIILPG